MKYYCIGIKGTGMSTLAQILYDLGNEVSGYDDTVEYKFTQKGLDERNIKIYNDHNHDLDKDTIVTFSVAFKDSHPEIQRVKELGLQIKKYNEIVGEITREFNTICVSGTHGKTSTSSMVKHILENSIGCNYFIGSGNGHVTRDNKILVIESDEFNKHFLAYYPTNTIITNMEKEHMECYTDLDDIINTFSSFASKTKEHIVACGDNINTHKLKVTQNITYYGFDIDNEYVIKNSHTTNEGENFDLYHEDELIGSFLLPLFGEHMVLNATAAIIMCMYYGISIDTIASLLKTFKNEERRFAETVIGNTIIIDDYAHHPTEIMATMKGARRKYPNKKLVVVFKPNTYSRVKDFTNEFITALNLADKVYLTEIDSNRELASDYPGVSSALILNGLKNAEMINEDTIDKLLSEQGNVICFMSCASVSHLISAYKNLLEDKKEQYESIS